MSDDGLMGRAELERAFAALGDRLVRRGVVADLFIVGGAAMALAYDAERVTRDVDATFVPHGVVLEEARNVAQAMSLPPWWLNEQASSYVSAQHDAGRREVFDHPGIRDGELRVGSAARLKQPGQSKATWTVTQLEPLRVFTWRTERAGLCLTGRHLLEPAGTGTRMTLVLETAGWAAGVASALFGGKMRSSLQQEAAGFARAATEVH
ncbi:hypothetical protein Acy02nite_62380 [Actinoplanes cyaneus]|uniref:Polyketide cyclase n=1 Tax=Actinoplanes cyaneus TaxID=52696 RepID=A0A919IQ27_9ACTN|nr:SRPBCC family protein [Actinoplanes cyaneus]MCW2141563.1 Polyketide cyclase / dehydrase and lipid transport [Actinoplanes cyaneus]GID68357.1 hypothetical protein Acy02nite_62380 [Actinoplanes cyaneus]